MVAGPTVTDSRAERADLPGLGVEPAVDDVLAGFDESTPEEIMALAETADASERSTEFAVDDDFFEDFLTEDVRPVAVSGEREGREQGRRMDDLFASRR